MNSTSDEILANLAAELSQVDQREKNWLTIGDALHALEARDAKTINGRPWHVVLQAFLEEQGLSVTTGHLNKVRRVRKFVRDNIGSEISDDKLTETKVQFSALEMAERLHTLDQKAGAEALKDCIEGLTFGEMRDRYEGFRDAHPELLPPRQLAWMRKRAIQKSDDATSVARRQEPRQPTDFAPSNVARQLYQTFIEQIWREAYEKGWSDAVAGEAEKDLMIKALRAQITDLETRIASGLKSDF